MRGETEEGAFGPVFAPAETTVPFDRVRFSEYLARQGLAYDPNEALRQFAGGLANRNYLVTIDGAPAVLRRPPEGDLPPGAHDMRRENHILSRLSKALPFVPEGLHYCADPGVIGAPFQLIAYRRGLVIRGDDMSPLAHRPDAPGRLSAMLVETLARLHAVDPASVGLDDLGRPAGFIERGIAGWAKRGGLVTEGTPAARMVEEVASRLAAQRFAERAPTLLHCDFKLDNVILDPVSLGPNAVVDWDMGTRGDPLFDLATMLSYWAQPGDPDCMLRLHQMPTTQPGFLSRREAAELYASATGRDISDLPAMLVLCRLKLGIIFLQLHRQWVTGAVTDPRYEAFGRLGADLVAHAADLSLKPEL
ncbi:phosphotransferase family protein [Enterovirga rhinocerotis]|uniref:Aminoglycoside phosphotransferase (APT) family kinase protein n=1 Tax=Enterovirga rhinocerotis TaxID=1339210 RepID=A0A4R7C8D4_9HYPH|nr:phosphotransferase family protein [Enterovirga rhinocerotis]TDR93565.1 aminoglycoside phosphotransferase (APT) family kinase protein [Enterovirga rhinocerotis]